MQKCRRFFAFDYPLYFIKGKNCSDLVIHCHKAYKNSLFVNSVLKSLLGDISAFVGCDSDNLKSRLFKLIHTSCNARVLKCRCNDFVALSFHKLNRTEYRRIVCDRSARSEKYPLRVNAEALCDYTSCTFKNLHCVKAFFMKRRRISEVIFHCPQSRLASPFTRLCRCAVIKISFQKTILLQITLF